MKPSITLYANTGYSSPYVLSVYAALVEKGLPFTIEAVNLAAGTQHGLAYSRLSLTSRVPTLVDGGFALSESSAIVEYLDEAYPAPDYPAVYPADLHQRARARQIQAWLRSDLAALREERPTTVIYASKNPQALSKAARRAADKLLAAADSLIDDSGGNLFGQWCIADVDLSVMLNRLHANGDPVPDKIVRYVQRQSARPSVENWWQLARR